MKYSKKQITKKENSNDFYILGVGNSSGGLKALKEFIKNHKSGKDVSFVAPSISHSEHEELRLLKEALKKTKENLESTIKKLENTNNELQSLHVTSKTMELKLRQSEERFRLALKGTGSALWEWSDLKEDNAWWSKEIYKLLGYTEKELPPLFSTLINLIHPDQIKIFRSGLEAHVEKNTPFEVEILVKTKNDGYKWFRINAQMLTDEYNTAKKIVGTILDINVRKKSEREMQHLNEELESFAYLASHDLKEPLNTITSFSSLIKQECNETIDKDAKVYLNFIDNATSRMVTLTNDLLIFLQLGNKPIHFTEVNLNTVIDSVKKELKNTIEATKAEIIICKKLPVVICEHKQVTQLLRNLIYNGLKYRSEKPPVIELSYSEKISYYEIKVKDNGIGIEEKYHTKIFEVFKRLHNRDQYEGNGIGLANCKRIVSNHGGRIWVISEENKGSEFIFTIPKNI